MVLCDSNSIGPRHKSRMQILTYHDFVTDVYKPIAIRAVAGHSGIGKLGESELFDMLKPFTEEMAEHQDGSFRPRDSTRTNKEFAQIERAYEVV